MPDKSQRSPFMSSTMQSVNDITKDALKMTSDIKWALQFQTDKDGQQINLQSVQKIAPAAAPTLKGIIESYKIVKGLIQKAPK
eukprot:6086632-Alexandrium_andersonii.AAC.1